MKYDFIAIGDITTDAFIRLETPSAHIDIDKGKREIAMSFAAKIPYEEVYLSSLGADALHWHEDLLDYFNQHPQINLVFQPGGYQITAGKEKLGGIYRRAKVVIVNKEESQTILETDEDDIKKLLQGIKDLGAEIAVITDGVKGAYASYDGEDWDMPPYPDPTPPLARTGA